MMGYINIVRDKREILMSIRTNKRILSVLFLVFVLALPLFAQERAVVEEITGKVELKAPGRSWVPASPGMEVSKGTVISTGFNSSVSLDLGNSELFVRQLTRLTLEELVRQEGTVTTSVALKVGKVKAKVKSAEGLTHNFTLRSSTSTASVRGTELEFDGFLIEVSEGRVVFMDPSGTEEFVFEGESSGGEDALNVKFGVSPYASEEGGIGLGSPGEGTGTIIVIAN